MDSASREKSFSRRKVIVVLAVASSPLQEEGKVPISDNTSENNPKMMMTRLPTIVGEEDDRRWLRTVITAPEKKKKREKRKRKRNAGNQRTRSDTYVNGMRRSRRRQRAVKRKSRCNGKRQRCPVTAKDTGLLLRLPRDAWETHFFEKRLPQCQRGQRYYAHADTHQRG